MFLVNYFSLMLNLKVIKHIFDLIKHIFIQPILKVPHHTFKFLYLSKYT